MDETEVVDEVAVVLVEVLVLAEAKQTRTEPIIDSFHSKEIFLLVDIVCVVVVMVVVEVARRRELIILCK